jgi:antibiotic biosynthesis monooxygenase (ABM) superfamily enzyme
MIARENSQERKELLSELNGLATQTYDKMAGVETWFHLPEEPHNR